MPVVPDTVLCSGCGIPVLPNTANMCVHCLNSEVDSITKGLPTRLLLVHCPECESYLLHPPRAWVKLQPHSKELLTFCLKKLQKNLNDNTLRLVRAQFRWTGCCFSKSKRVIVRFVVQKDGEEIIKRSHNVMYLKLEKMCESCSMVQQKQQEAANPDDAAEEELPSVPLV